VGRSHRLPANLTAEENAEVIRESSKLFTPERTQAIVTFLRSGSFIETAVAASGVSRSTFFVWMKRGEKAHMGKFRKFYLDVRKAMADFEIAAVNSIRRAGEESSWQASAWLLERKFPDEWGKIERVESTGANGGPIEVAAMRDPREMTTGEKRRLLAQLDAEDAEKEDE
jgi:hypothetical protein